MNKKAIALFCAAVLALSLLSACGAAKPSDPTAPPAETAASEPTQAPTAESTEVPADAPTHVASAEDMIEPEEVVEDGMTPIYAQSIHEGTYPVEMKSSSSMFRVDHSELIVADGKLSAALYINSDAYLYLFPGTAEEADAAGEAAWITSEKTQDGMNRFLIPVEALDAGVPCAAFSARKQLWYDRTLLFRADSLPLEAYAEGVLATVESLGLTDGKYTAEVALSGGSGKASVASPAVLTVEDGQCTAEIVFSSSKYDYVKIGETKYLPVNTEGNATFLLPVAAFDYRMPILADTTAMSQAHEISYTLCFDSGSITPAE